MKKKYTKEEKIEIGRRLQEAIKAVKIPATVVADAIGIEYNSITKYYTGRAMPNYLQLDVIEEIFLISKNYIMTGDGDMLVKEKDKLINHTGKGVPYYASDVSASIVRSFNDIPDTPEFFIDFKPFNDCTAYFTVFGDSMYPKFASGEIIAVKAVTNPDIIWWGEPYLVITDESADSMRTIKLLHQCEDNHDCVVLRASNPNFKGDVIIPRESIISLYLVKGKITRSQL